MNTPIINTATILNELKQLINARDATGFVCMGQAVKARAIELIHQDQQSDASTLLSEYSRAFVGVDVEDPDFILAVLPLFPKNAHGTLKFIGLRDDLDLAILASKVDLPAMKLGDDFSALIEMAIGKKDWSMVERIVLHMTQHVAKHRPDDARAQREVVNGILQAFVYGKDCLPPMPSSIDDAICSIVNHTADWRLGGEFFDRLARMEMPKTFMKMLEHGRIDPFPCKQTLENEHIFACLPENMTVKQLYAASIFLETPSFKHRLLFDEQVSIDDFIQTLRDTHFFGNRESCLSVSTLERLSKLFTTEHIAVPARRQRIARLLNAVVEQKQEKGFTHESIRKSLTKAGVPAHAMKLIDLFKSEELEDALGL